MAHLGHDFAKATFNAISATIATELGDKTFCIAAIMAMRYNRAYVFAGALGALIVMSVLSVVIGIAFPALMPRAYTHYAAAALFAYFGVKLLIEARSEEEGEGGGEMEEAEKELGLAPTTHEDKAAEDKAGHKETAEAAVEQEGTVAIPVPAVVARAAPSSSTDAQQSSAASGSDSEEGETAVLVEADPSAKTGSKIRHGTVSPKTLQGMLALLLLYLPKDWPVFTQSFSITFIAEWGDRSQIATIAMAAAQNAFGICLGAVIGHTLCTGLAVLGGRMLASRISEKGVALVGGILFLIFAVHSLAVGPPAPDA